MAGVRLCRAQSCRSVGPSEETNLCEYCPQWPGPARGALLLLRVPGVCKIDHQCNSVSVK